MTQFNILEAKEHFVELIHKVAHGEEIIIMEDNEPVAKLIKAEKTIAKRQFGTARGLVKIADDFNKPLEEFAEYQ